MSGSTSDQLALALGPYDNRKLFSDHFLSERLPAWPQFAAADPASLLRDHERDGRAPRRPGSASARTCAAATAPGAARPRDGGDDLIAEFECTTPAFIRELTRTLLGGASA